MIFVDRPRAAQTAGATAQEVEAPMQTERTEWLDQLDPAFGHWLAGFVDGEGCFTINYYRRSDSCSAMFSIALRDDDAEVLREIHATMGFGSLYQGRPRLAGRSKPQLRWSVQTKADALKLVVFFDRFPLRAKKARDYAIWRRAVMEWHSITHHAYAKHGDDQHAGMKALRRQLIAGRQYDTSPGIHTVEHRPLAPDALF